MRTVVHCILSDSVLSLDILWRSFSLTKVCISRSLPTFLHICARLCHSLIVGGKAHTSMQVRCCCSCEDSELHQFSLYSLSGKRPNVLCNIFDKTLAISMKFGTPFPEQICCKSCKRFPPHLNNVSTLPCETSNAPSDTCCHWVVAERNSKIYPTSTVAPKFTRFKSTWLQHVRNIARESVKEYASVIWLNWNSDWKLGGPSWIMSSLRQPFVRGSGVVDSSRSLMRVLYTVSCNISHALLSTGFKMFSNLANFEVTVAVG